MVASFVEILLTCCWEMIIINHAWSRRGHQIGNVETYYNGGSHPECGAEWRVNFMNTPLALLQRGSLSRGTWEGHRSKIWGREVSAVGKEHPAVNEEVEESPWCTNEEWPGLIVILLNLSVISSIGSVGLLEQAWESSVMAPLDRVVTKSSQLVSPMACWVFTQLACSLWHLWDLNVMWSGTMHPLGCVVMHSWHQQMLVTEWLGIHYLWGRLVQQQGSNNRHS